MQLYKHSYMDAPNIYIAEQNLSRDFKLSYNEEPSQDDDGSR